MPLYRTQYITPAGTKHRDHIEAPNLHELRAIVRRRGNGRVIKAKAQAGQEVKQKKIREKDLVLLMELLATYLEGDVQILDSIDKLKESPAFTKDTRAVLRSVHAQIAESRCTFSQACGQYPKAFPRDMVMTLRIAENNGSKAIAETLRSLWEERRFLRELRQEVLASSIYPCFIFLALAGLLVTIFTSLLPKLQDLVDVSAAPPPASMQRLLALSAFFGKFGPVLILGAALAILGVGIACKQRQLRDRVDRVILRTPFLGMIVKEYSVASICKKYRALYKAGELPAANLTACAEATKNRAIAARLIQGREPWSTASFGQKVATRRRSPTPFAPPGYFRCWP